MYFSAYHFDPSCVWPAAELVPELRACRMQARLNGDNVEVQIEIDRLMPAASRLWCWMQHSCLRKWDVFIVFKKDRFLRNVEIQVYRKFPKEYEDYIGESIKKALKKIGCIELLTTGDELTIAERIGGRSSIIGLAIDTLRDSILDVDHIPMQFNYQELAQYLNREKRARCHLDLLLFDRVGLSASQTEMG